MCKSILFVDDEKQILRSLKRVFIGSEYKIYLSENGEEALKLLEKTKIDLIITDIKMPVMDGYNLLKEVREKYSSTIRVVLSGNLDGNILIKIQNNCLAKLYLFKPWENDELIKTIENIFSVEKVLKKKNLLEIINCIDFLPSSEGIYNRFNRLVEKDADISKIAKVIENDPSISAKILQVTNSTMFGFKTGSITQAITYLGIISVKSIVFNASLYKGLENIGNRYIINDLNVFWNHSIMTNRIVSFLYQRLLNKKIPNDCAMAGLLHDIGKVVLLSKYTQEYLDEIKNIIKVDNIFYYYEEMDFLNITHPEIGGYLLEWWGLPYPIVESALFHHNPLDKNIINKELVSLVHISDIYSWNILDETGHLEVSDEVLNLFNMSKENSDSIYNEIKNILK